MRQKERIFRGFFLFLLIICYNYNNSEKPVNNIRIRKMEEELC